MSRDDLVLSVGWFIIIVLPALPAGAIAGYYDLGRLWLFPTYILSALVFRFYYYGHQILDRRLKRLSDDTDK